ncbi:beta-1,4-glucuronyltransferase 1-like [Styela clava]
MRIRRVACLLFAGFCVIQLTLLYFENLDIQRFMPNEKTNKPYRVLRGYNKDSTGKYLIHRFYKSEGFNLDSIEPEDVTLVTHCTVDRLHHIIGLTETWAGPMSIAIFAPGTDSAFADDAIDGLRLCWPVLRKLANFHLVYPKHESTRANMSSAGDFVYLSCKDIMRRMVLKKSLLESQHSPGGLGYPHNLMRNVALSGVLTNFVLTVDIEMIPSENLRKDFLEFAKENHLHPKPHTVKNNQEYTSVNKTVFVVPAFEVKKDSEIGGTKQSIIAAMRKSDARPLLQETCPQCQVQTNYEKWASTSGLVHQFGVAYEAEFATGWEPFFISSRMAPWFDEKLTKFGHDRLSQICELKSNEYTFKVINNGFLIVASFRIKSRMTEEEHIRKENKITFKDQFRAGLRKSGRIASDLIGVC